MPRTTATKDFELQAGPRPAVAFTNGLLATDFAKTCHGLLRGSERFNLVAVIDAAHAGEDAGRVLDGRELGIPVYAGLAAFFEALQGPAPRVFAVGVAFPGGRLPDSARGEIVAAIERGMTVVCGLHQLLSEDPELSELAARSGATLIDVRKPRPVSSLHFWTGEVLDVETPRVAVLGTDCALGKRTTCRLLMEACRERGLPTEMIYTGQTGWMQGSPWGFILDAIPNDFVSGELEHAILRCDREASPRLILIEGQSSLRNPSGPCGSELLLSANASGVVLQHAPGRTYFVDLEERGLKVPTAEEEVALIRHYGFPVLAVTLNGHGMSESDLVAYQRDLEERLLLPVVRPLEQGLERVVEALNVIL